MRTGSPLPLIGGGPHIRVSPSASLSPMPSVRHPAETASLRDVEAALVIAKLGGAGRFERSPTGQIAEDVDAVCRSDAVSQSRFTHIRTAVMPERHSYVQKVLKRKIEDRMEAALTPERSPREEDSLDHDVPLQTAIENERGYFGNVKRCRYQADIEAPKREEAVGRFVRTCQPHRQNEHELANRPSQFNISPLSHKRESPVIDQNGQALSGFIDNRYWQERRNVLSAETSRQSHSRMPFVERCYDEIIHPGRQSHALAKGSPVADVSRPADLPVAHHVLSDQTSRQYIPLRQSRHCITPGRDQCVLNSFRRCEPSTAKNANLSAYYTLGRHVASALSSPVCHLPILNSQQSFAQKNGSHTVESRETCIPISGCDSVHRYQNTSGTTLRKKTRRVDSKTENKVKNGEFGTLKTLQNFYKKLSSPKSGIDQKPVMRGRLGSITNYSHYQHMCLSVKAGSANNGDGEETAIDLSMHSLKASSNAADARFEVARPGNGLRRKSRSCCTTPYPEPALLAVHNSNESASLSPFHKQIESIVKPEITNSNMEDGQEAHDSLLSQAKTESRLPLKKRRLIEVSSTDKVVSDQESGANLPFVKKEVLSDAEITDNMEDISTSVLLSAVRSDEDGDLPLHIAVAQSNLEAVDRILDIMSRLGMSLDYYNNLKQTPLLVAVLTGEPLVIRRLLDGGASPNVIDRNGLTSVHHAARLQSSGCLLCLLEHSKVPVNINAMAYNGLTALHLASRCGNSQAVMMLIEAGARVDVGDGINGRTPLSFAVEQNSIQIVKILLAHGANPSLQNCSGSSFSKVAIPPWCRTDVAKPLTRSFTTGVRG